VVKEAFSRKARRVQKHWDKWDKTETPNWRAFIFRDLAFVQHKFFFLGQWDMGQK
jgi:hypothetical protein